MPVTSSAHLYNAREAERQRTGPDGAQQRPGRALEAADRGAWSVTATFPPQPRNVGRARLLTGTALAAWGAGALADTAQLVVSELVTNAVRYGRGAISITLALTDTALQISVADFGRELPQVREAGEEDSTGRGLTIVTTLCEQWTVTTRLSGKTISCWLGLP
ncbi:ATP-binding protein [Kitasatospora sp. GP82]|uniref:ATP-binding protein n=1 Tax=Kitasatospora sp. GP82 TaxID=3035089 RepID=UPI0024754EB6|nr:ATP-binding protein [Kitasatospora sp. GP82]MDH6123287.1 anti-sigma regulatory factor (Ser/Thr protein kinase) [Kitasatospora sp. GP82]